MNDFAVLHVTSMPGGGVNRHLHDVVGGVPRRHLVWHVGDGAEVMALPREERYVPIDARAFEGDPGALAPWLRQQGVGVVHAHSVQERPRARAQWAMHALQLPLVATLHDVLFLGPRMFEPHASQAPDAAWLAETSRFLAGAAARIAPSEYIAALARRHLPGQDVAVIPNGSRPADRARAFTPRSEFLARRPAHEAVAIGALGPHKGAAIVDEAARLLAGSGIGIVLIGFTGEHRGPGWAGENLYVHGPWDDDDTPALVRGYGGEVALFPHLVPESFSYALSDAWSAGLPALVAPEGALGERVRRHDGGWLLPQGFGAHDVAAALRRIFAPEAAAELARLKSRLSGEDAHRVPTVAAMNRSLDALYTRHGIDPRQPLDLAAAPAQALIAKHLDFNRLRPELAALADDVSQLRAGLEIERGQARRFETEAREWIAKLEADVAAVQAELREAVAERTRLERQHVELMGLPLVRTVVYLGRRWRKWRGDARD
jgi:hypothetical protein